MNDNFINEYFGIGIQNGKTPENLGVLWRTAQNLGATFIFTIGNRYAKQACDTHDAHPRRCVYLLGAEDHGLSKKAMQQCHHLIKFKSQKSLNVSVAGSIVMYDRNLPKPRS